MAEFICISASPSPLFQHFCLPPPPAGTSLDCRPLTPPYPRLAPQVPRSEASTFSASHHVAYFEASAKLRLNVDEAFEQLVRAVR